MPRWGMVIDLRRCIGCRNCVMLCVEANGIPPDRWRRVVDLGVSGPPERQRTFLPMNCMQCDDPPCLEVCPTGATFQRPDGIVDVDVELCVGCGYCVVACPYKARTILSGHGLGAEVALLPYEVEVALIESDHTGVATKCNFCISRVERGLAQRLRPGVDPEASPACVIACSTGAMYFGDLDDPESEVSRLIRENKTARMQEELGTGPAVYYIVGSLGAGDGTDSTG